MKILLQRRSGGRFFEAAWFRYPIVMLSGTRWRGVLALGPWTVVFADHGKRS